MQKHAEPAQITKHLHGAIQGSTSDMEAVVTVAAYYVWNLAVMLEEI